MTNNVLPFPSPAAAWLKSVRLADIGDNLRIAGTARSLHGQLVAIAMRGVGICPNVREVK